MNRFSEGVAYVLDSMSEDEMRNTLSHTNESTDVNILYALIDNNENIVIKAIEKRLENCSLLEKNKVIEELIKLSKL